MKINVHTSTHSGDRGKVFEIPNKNNMTVHEMVSSLLGLCPDLRNELLSSNGDLDPNSHILISGMDVGLFGKPLGAVIALKDTIDIFPAIFAKVQKTTTREMRSMPLWLLNEYLVELGGIAVNENLILGDGWRVKLERMPPFRFASLEVGQVRVNFIIDEVIEAEFLKSFAMKTLRAGA